MDRPLVLIEWIDSARHADGWGDEEEIEDHAPAYCRSVGWVFKETDEMIEIVPHTSSTGQVLGGISIPRCAIIDCTALKEE